jgi:hypothetical protein
VAAGFEKRGNVLSGHASGYTRALETRELNAMLGRDLPNEGRALRAKAVLERVAAAGVLW